MADIKDYMIQKFPPDLENHFQRYYFKFALTMLKVSIPISIVIYLGFFLWDALYSPDLMLFTFTVRFFFALFGAIVYVTLFTSIAARYFQYIITAYGVVATLGICMILYVHPSGYVAGVAGVGLVIMYGSIFFFLQFRYSAFFNMFAVLTSNLFMWLGGYERFAFLNANFFIVSSAITGMAYNYMFEVVLRRYFSIERQLAAEKAESARLIKELMPEWVMDRVQKGEKQVAQAFGDATVLFSDMVGFTSLAGKVSPGHLVEILSKLFGRFDEVAIARKLERIKTIGDGYMLVGGVPTNLPDSAASVVECAKDFIQIVREFSAATGLGMSIRVGVATGAVVCGVLSTRKPVYDLWGETVNIASRLESTGQPNRVHVSETTYYRTRQLFTYEELTEVKLKGIGPMRTFLLVDDKCREDDELGGKVLNYPR
jgi:adenylate cyclase